MELAVPLTSIGVELEEVLMSRPCRAIALDGQSEVNLRRVSHSSASIFVAMGDTGVCQSGHSSHLIDPNFSNSWETSL